MEIEQFERLSDEEKLSVISKKLLELKRKKIKVTDGFPNEEFNFSWTTVSNKMKEIGYSLDQKNYIMNRFVRSGEKVISNKEMNEYIKMKDVINEYELKISEINAELEGLRVRVKNDDEVRRFDYEVKIEKYVEEERESFVANIPIEVNRKWKQYNTNKIYEKYVLLSAALIECMENYKEEKDILYDVIMTTNQYKGADTTSLSLKIPKTVNQMWKETVKENKNFNNMQMTTYALEKFMENYGSEDENNE